MMEKETHYAKAKWAKKLGVSTSGYYTWLQERDRRQKAQKSLEDRVISIFKEGEGTYGVDRICGILRRDGEPASYPVIKRIMCQEGLKSCYRRRRQRSLTDSRKARGDEYKNLTKDLVIDKPFQVLIFIAVILVISERAKVSIISARFEMYLQIRFWLRVRPRT